MRKLAITISGLALVLASSGAFATCFFGCGPHTHNYDGAGAWVEGGSSNIVISNSSTVGTGLSINKGFAASQVKGSGYAKDSFYGLNGYKAGVDASTMTATGAMSVNLGNASGGVVAISEAGANGGAGGYADSYTHYPFQYPPMSEAEAYGGGGIGLYSDSISVSGGPGITYGANISGAKAGAHFWGYAETTGNNFWAKAGDVKYAKTYSAGIGQSAGDAGAYAEGGNYIYGSVAHDLWQDD